MSRFELENNIFGFSASEEVYAEVQVQDGVLDFTYQTQGPYRPAGTLNKGDTGTFTQPTTVIAYDLVVFDLTYPQNHPDGSETPAPPLPEHEPPEDWEEGETDE